MALFAGAVPDDSARILFDFGSPAVCAPDGAGAAVELAAIGFASPLWRRKRHACTSSFADLNFSMHSRSDATAESYFPMCKVKLYMELLNSFVAPPASEIVPSGQPASG